MKVSAPAVETLRAADIRNRRRADKIEAAGRHDALAALPDSCQHISRILAEQFDVDTEFEIDPDNSYIEDIPTGSTNMSAPASKNAYTSNMTSCSLDG